MFLKFRLFLGHEHELMPPKIYPLQCNECHKKFSHLNNLKIHEKIHLKNTNSARLLECSLCQYKDPSEANILHHFDICHNIKIQSQNHTFKSELDFQKWKTDLEKKNSLSYRYTQCYETSEGAKKTIYICHRSGYYVKKGKGIRHLKIQGSKKIGGLCPSKLRVSVFKNGSCEVNFIETHVGHDHLLGHLNITDIERNQIATKIAAKIPLTCILDEIRDSITNNKLERMHLLTRKDLHNIAQLFNLNNEGIRHKNEVVSIESWIQEVQDSEIILFYKPQGELCDEFPYVKKDDIILIIMHPGQLEVLQQFSEDVICIDATHGLNAHDFELTTLLILDNMREGFPCCFMFGNRSDEEIIKIFFKKIKEKLGRTIEPQVFMSDMAPQYYSAWLQIMTPAKFR